MNSVAAFACSSWVSAQALNGPPIIEPKGIPCNTLVATCEGVGSSAKVITFKDFPNVGNYFGRENREMKKRAQVGDFLNSCFNIISYNPHRKRQGKV